MTLAVVTNVPGFKCYRVVSVEWFSTMTSLGCLGLVAAVDMNSGDLGVYLGVGSGKDEAADVAQIIQWGAKIDPTRLRGFFKTIFDEVTSKIGGTVQ